LCLKTCGLRRARRLKGNLLFRVIN
jgi:hypothetical protein